VNHTVRYDVLSNLQLKFCFIANFTPDEIKQSNGIYSELCFKLISESTKRMFVWKAENQMDKSVWMKAFKDAIDTRIDNKEKKEILSPIPKRKVIIPQVPESFPKAVPLEPSFPKVPSFPEIPSAPASFDSAVPKITSSSFPEIPRSPSFAEVPKPANIQFPAIPSTPTCHRCQQKINSKSVDSMGKKWHEGCFLCEHCHRSLIHGASFIEGQLICTECYTTQFVLKCAKCGKGIQSAYASFEGKDYHEDCLVCQRCGTSLSSGFIREKDTFLCVRCGKAPVVTGKLKSNHI